MLHGRFRSFHSSTGSEGSISRDRDLFWPLSFLALGPDLCLARILTFGYDATLKEGGNAGHSVVGFANDLLFDLKYAADERKEASKMGSVSTRLIFSHMKAVLTYS